MHSLFRVCAAALLLAALTAVAAPGPDTRPTTEGLLADAQALEAAWYAGIPSVTPGQPIQRLRLTLVKAANNKDLTIEAFRLGSVWLAGRAWGPDWTLTAREADAAGLKLDGGDGQRALEGTLLLRLLPEGGEAADGAALEATFQVQVWLKGTALAGTYKSLPPADAKRALPKAAGVASGELTPVDAPTPPAECPRPRVAALDLAGRYRAGVLAEAAAARNYQRLRALNIARRTGTPAREVLAEMPGFVPVRPVLRATAAGTTGPTGPEDPLGGDDVTIGPPRLSPADERAAIEGLAAMAGVVARMKQCVERPAAAAFATEGLSTDDPDFGPWFGEDTLGVRDDGTHLLPAEAGGPGAQRWAGLTRWRLLGPAVPVRWAWHTPTMPDLISEPTSRYAVETGRLREGGSYNGDATMGWLTARGSGAFSDVAPPNWSSANRVYRQCPPPFGHIYRYSGLEYSACYATAEVEAERACELWVAVGLNQRGKLWLNERLFWAGPADPDNAQAQSVALLRVPFVQGVNRLLLRVDVNFSSPSFWMRVCTQGAPRDAATVKADADARAKATATLPRATTGSSWRGDGTSVYPTARPPLAWNYKTKLNTPWWTTLPYWGNATPAIAGDRIFVTVEPHWLYCLRKSDGQILWKRAVTALDLLPADKRQAGWKLYDAWEKARRERDAIPQSVLTPDKWLRYEWYWAEGTGIWAGKDEDERKGASPEVIALLDKRDALEKSPDPEVVADELSRVLEQIKALKAKAGDPQAQEAQAKVSALSTATSAFIGFMRAHSHVRGQDGYWYDYDGWAFASAVTDGAHVWWKSGMEAVACFDMDGNEVWKIDNEGGAAGSPTITSPLLVDGKLVMMLPDWSKNRGRNGWRMTALDAKTGKLAWETRDIEAGGWGAGTPAALRLTNGRESMAVIVTTAGQLLRADDGKLLRADLGARDGDTSPLVVRGDTVIFNRPNLCAVRLIMLDRDHVGAKLLWARTAGPHGIDYGGVVSDGELLYYVGGGDRDTGASERWNTLNVFDVATGALVNRLPILRKGGNTYSPSAVVGDYVYLTSGDQIFSSGGPKAPSDLVVVTRGRHPIVVAQNAIDRLYGAPAVDGDRIYLRGYLGVTCIGYTGAEGKQSEAAIVARTVRDGQFAGRPVGGAPVEAPVTPEPGLQKQGYGGGNPWSTLTPGRAPHTWAIAGPAPLARADALRASVLATRVTNGATVNDGVAVHLWTPLAQDALKLPGAKPWVLNPHGFTFIDRMRRVIDLGTVLQGKAGTVVYLCAEVFSEHEQTVRFELDTPNASAWLAGQPLTHGDRAHLGKGYAQLIIEVRVAAIPPDGLTLSPRFWSSEDPAAELAAWEADTKARDALLKGVGK